MDEQRHITKMGGTMRLGAYPCNIKRGTLAGKLYGKLKISERHRHRYEVNNEYRKTLEDAGFVFSGLSPDEKLVEIAEFPNHPFFIGCQFHPELKSRPMSPHPLFNGLVEAALKYRKEREITSGEVADPKLSKNE
jgi:CTP synthase